MKENTSFILTSNPPQRRWECSCGNVVFSSVSKEQNFLEVPVYVPSQDSQL